MKSALLNNLSSNESLAHLFAFIKNVNGELTSLIKQGLSLHPEDRHILSQEFPPLLEWIQNTLGILKTNHFFELLNSLRLEGHLSPATIAIKIAQREEARKNKDWSLSDNIRQELQDAGVALQDTPTGTHWTLILQ